MGRNLSTNLPMFVYTFQAMWRHRPLEEYLIFVGIHAAYTSFSPFTLVGSTPLRSINRPRRTDTSRSNTLDNTDVIEIGR